MATAAAQQAPPGSTPMQQMSRTMNAKAFEKLKLLFRTSHAIAKHCRPFTDYVWTCNVDEIKGY